MGMQVQCPGVVQTTVEGVPLCVDDFGAALAWEAVPPFAIDYAQAAEPFAVGFLLMASFWALGHGVSLVIDLVRR